MLPVIVQSWAIFRMIQKVFLGRGFRQWNDINRQHQHLEVLFRHDLHCNLSDKSFHNFVPTFSNSILYNHGVDHWGSTSTVFAKFKMKIEVIFWCGGNPGYLFIEEVISFTLENKATLSCGNFGYISNERNEALYKTLNYKNVLFIYKWEVKITKKRFFRNIQNESNWLDFRSIRKIHCGILMTSLWRHRTWPEFQKSSAQYKFSIDHNAKRIRSIPLTSLEKKIQNWTSLLKKSTLEKNWKNESYTLILCSGVNVGCRL